jgi:hypothetical protein
MNPQNLAPKIEFPEQEAHEELIPTGPIKIKYDKPKISFAKANSGGSTTVTKSTSTFSEISPNIINVGQGKTTKTVKRRLSPQNLKVVKTGKSGKVPHAQPGFVNAIIDKSVTLKPGVRLCECKR